ncbi:helix-turn-helix transcriptional regulator [Loktanella sp. SALINAS62]|nr:metalloregulator ArsR/SmtB family transcription factor [Loktanella sp. SALINAS62]MBS1301226.1 helix-turn-helix transcriptional regulator [Loktanella sp. SALINAS62]
MSLPLNAFFAALSDPTRRAVLEQLSGGPKTVSALAAPHDIALPSFMKHLAKLEAAGLVRSVKKGRVRTCHLNTDPLIEAQGWLAWQRAIWERQLGSQDQLALSLDEADDPAHHTRIPPRHDRST